MTKYSFSIISSDNPEKIHPLVTTFFKYKQYSIEDLINLSSDVFDKFNVSIYCGFIGSDLYISVTDFENEFENDPLTKERVINYVTGWFDGLSAGNKQ